MATSRLFFLSTLVCICLQSFSTFGQEDPFGQDPSAQKDSAAQDPFEPYENAFRDAPEDETVEQRALALLQSQSYSIQSLEAQLKNHKTILNAEEQRRIALQKAITSSLNRHFQGSLEEQQFALNTLESVLNTYPTREGRRSMIWLEGSIEDHLEKGLGSEDLKTSVIKFFGRHLTSKGLILGYQPCTGNWRPVSDVTDKATGELREKLRGTFDCYYQEYTLEEALDDLSMISGVNFDHQLSDEQKALQVTYINDEVSFGKALSEILTQHDLDYAVEEQRVLIGSKDERRIMRNDIFVVRGLLSSEVNVEKLVELTKTVFKDQQPEFHLVDQNTFATIGTETQLNKVSKFLGNFRPAVSIEESDAANRLHPAAVFANRVLKAIHDEELEVLAEFANVGDEDKERFFEFVKDIEGWFQGVSEISEMRREGDSYFAKIRKSGDEIMVIRIDLEDGDYTLYDFNSPSVEDYTELELVPLVQDKK